MATVFARRLARVAEEQYDQFRLFDENDPPLSAQIRRYWTEVFGAPQKVSVAWSAAFVCWCLKKAGATSAEFPFESAHARFVYKLIHGKPAGAPFTVHDVDSYAPKVGDIVHNNRSGGTIDFAAAGKTGSYESHSAIVIEKGVDSGGPYILTIGGNESNSVGKKLIRLKSSGIIKQRTTNPYISVIENLK